MDEDEISQSFVIARDYYFELGFSNRELPCVASLEATRVTYPVGNLRPYFEERYLVGSGEQSFVDEMLRGQLRPGRWMTLTPCFRNEAVYDDLHRPLFHKLELIHYMPIDPFSAVHELTDVAALLFESFEVRPTVVQNFIELGSYGFRRYKDHVWAFGTGLAQPRLSQVLHRLRR